MFCEKSLAMNNFQPIYNSNSIKYTQQDYLPNFYLDNNYNFQKNNKPEPMYVPKTFYKNISVLNPICRIKQKLFTNQLYEQLQTSERNMNLMGDKRAELLEEIKRLHYMDKNYEMSLQNITKRNKENNLKLYNLNQILSKIREFENKNFGKLYLLLIDNNKQNMNTKRDTNKSNYLNFPLKTVATDLNGNKQLNYQNKRYFTITNKDDTKVLIEKNKLEDIANDDNRNIDDDLNRYNQNISRIFSKPKRKKCKYLKRRKGSTKGIRNIKKQLDKVYNETEKPTYLKLINVKISTTEKSTSENISFTVNSKPKKDNFVLGENEYLVINYQLNNSVKGNNNKKKLNMPNAKDWIIDLKKYLTKDKIIKSFNHQIKYDPKSTNMQEIFKKIFKKPIIIDNQDEIITKKKQKSTKNNFYYKTKMRNMNKSVKYNDLIEESGREKLNFPYELTFKNNKTTKKKYGHKFKHFNKHKLSNESIILNENYLTTCRSHRHKTKVNTNENVPEIKKQIKSIDNKLYAPYYFNLTDLDKTITRKIHHNKHLKKHKKNDNSGKKNKKKQLNVATSFENNIKNIAIELEDCKGTEINENNDENHETTENYENNDENHETTENYENDENHQMSEMVESKENLSEEMYDKFYETNENYDNEKNYKNKNRKITKSEIYEKHKIMAQNEINDNVTSTKKYVTEMKGCEESKMSTTSKEKSECFLSTTTDKCVKSKIHDKQKHKHFLNTSNLHLLKKPPKLFKIFLKQDDLLKGLSNIRTTDNCTRKTKYELLSSVYNNSLLQPVLQFCQNISPFTEEEDNMKTSKVDEVNTPSNKKDEQTTEKDVSGKNESITEEHVTEEDNEKRKKIIDTHKDSEIEMNLFPINIKATMNYNGSQIIFRGALYLSSVHKKPLNYSTD